MPASTTQKQQGGACPYRFKTEEFVDYRCTTQSTSPSTTNHRQNMRRSQIASKQARQRKGSWWFRRVLKNSKMWSGFSSLLFLVESVSLLQMSIYTHYTNILYTVRWSPLPSNNHHQDCLRCCWLGEYPKVYMTCMYIQISTIINKFDGFLSRWLHRPVYSTPLSV